MNELNDFLKLISEGKQETIKKSPGKAHLKQLQEEIHRDNPFLNLPVSKPPVAKQPTIEVVGEFLYENGNLVNTEVLTEVVVPEVKPAAEQVPMSVIDKYLKRDASFQQPDPDKVDPNFRAVQDKLKFLEQAIGRIAATGPGSGEVNFRWLDDVNRSTMDIPNDNWVLEYDAASGDVQFTEDIGPIRTVKFNTDGPSTGLVPGQIAYNPNEDCLDVRHADGTTLQTGLEQHIRVFNNGEDTLTQGTLVGFGGIVLDGDELPIATRFTATSTAMPLYIMGVLTNDIASGGVGRCTVFGKVRTLDTTGDSGLGETWAAGDLLWAHPTMPGRLTKHQPTAPYPAISVAAILRCDATQGVLLVRPTIFPRLWFGRFRDFTNQSAAEINTPYAVRFGQTAISSGFHIDTVHTSRVVAEFTGLYKFDPRLQFTSSNSSIAKIWVWYRVDGVDAVGTGTEYTIQSNGGIVVVTLPYIVSLQAGQYFELMWAVNSTNVSLLSPVATSFAPGTPCAVVAVTQANL